ncbi:MULTISPECIES: SIR2 family protein [unclassified Sphingomonas]|uniref:SIR2 family protein n=1 Tax=unclassified Sphingomonas TaxID=196159 RepID=UPI00226A3365|nr:MULTISPECIES: SIR2 family protein [unclassified Sphingomonas]
MPPPAAATIRIRATLDMLDGPKREFAEGVANDQYVFWLGSGISRDRMPDLRELAKVILITLQSRVDQGDDGCRFRRALIAVVKLAGPSEQEWADVDVTVPADQWASFEPIAGRLVNNYARMLNISVDGEEADYLLWNILDAATRYSDPTVEPDAEHLCLAALAIEGVASEMPSANWDPLVERAIARLAGNQPVMRVAVAPDDTRANRRRTNLYKFHGCAQAACDLEAKFRPLLVARQNQINGWLANNRVMGNALINLIVTKPTLMLGLSAQDSNIQGLFAEAQAQMPWRWPVHPPAYIFSENALGGDQESLLQNVYHQDHTPATRPQMENEALVQAYAKPLLLSLLLFVLGRKMQALVDKGLPGLVAADRQKLEDGIVHARNALADALVPTAERVGRLLTAVGRAMGMLREGATPAAAEGIYPPVTPDPVDRMPADPQLGASGVCEFALASALIGVGLQRGLWTATAPDSAAADSGALVLTGRSGPAKIYFVANSRAYIRLGTNGLIADNDDAVIVHSLDMPAPMARSPRRPPGRTGLSTIREVSMTDLISAGTEVEDLLARFRSRIAL